MTHVFRVTGTTTAAHDSLIPPMSTDGSSPGGSPTKSQSAHTSPTSTIRRRKRETSEEGDPKIMVSL